MSRRRWIAAGAVAVLVIAGFLLFRPDTLFTDVEADESLEEAFAATTTAEEEAGSTTTVAEPASTTTSPAVTTTAASVEPAQVTTGQFVGIDHSAQGTAAVYEQDGDFVLRFEDNTDIQNGPDLYVWLLADTSYQSGTPDEYIDLGLLKGTVGGQNYQLPDEFDPEVHRAVLIWCLRFAVPFAAAPLQ
ncbi:MAG TPA: DM13 domain-containing protein [Acidimicrobiia bacterium]|nr:DM13 domain-containing protein [Acidimicrobiia bacterium]